MLRVTLAVLSVTTAAAGVVGYDLLGPYSSDGARAVFFVALAAVIVLLAADAVIGPGRAAESF